MGAAATTVQEPTLVPLALRVRDCITGPSRELPIYSETGETPNFLSCNCQQLSPSPQQQVTPFPMCQSPGVTAPHLGKSQWLILVAGVQLLPSRLSPVLHTTWPLTLGKAQLKQHPAMCAKHCPALPWGFMLPRVCSYPVDMED